jgi:hypothetical protein
VELPRPDGPALLLSTAATPGVWWASAGER